MSRGVAHRTHVTGNPATCSCILRVSWPDSDVWPPGETLNYGSGVFCDFTTVLAVRRGHLKCLTYAVENGCMLHKSVYREDVVTAEQLQCIDYVIKRGLPIEDDAISAASRACNEKYLEKLIKAWREGGCTVINTKGETYDRPFTQLDFIGDVCLNSQNHQASKWKACIDLLRQAGNEWKTTHTRGASKYKNFDLLKLLVSQGCPWHKETLDYAEQSGNREMIEFAHAHERKLRQRANVVKLFEVLEKNKHQMTTQEYVEAAKAAQELHNGI
jgi:hypothetical protein